ncbi:hypothetical protein QQ73_13105, partial [Candidatus Endoriftia persephone str. Guaymas]|nr:hypothetical protein [Candidatus Endoriftia persephone str. Guaymas]
MNLGGQNCEAKLFAARRESQAIAGLLPRFSMQQREIWAPRLPFMIRAKAPYPLRLTYFFNRLRFW